MTTLEEYQQTFEAEPGYLDWAAFGPLSRGARAESQADAELLSAGRPSSIDLVSAHAQEARAAVAALVGGEAAEVTVQPSTTHGLMQAIYGLHGGVIVSRSEFPSTTVAVTRAADVLGRIRPQWIDPDDGFVTADAVAEAIDDDTTALAVSLVDFRTGYRADLTALREAIGPDRLLIVDAIQGFGVVTADYAAADVVCGNGYKWLRAGRGTGFAWFGPRALERLDPVLSGFAGTDGGPVLGEVPPPAPSAQAFTVSYPDMLAAARLAAALREVQDVGVDLIESELTARSGEVIRLAERYGIETITPQDAARRAGIVALAPEQHEVGPLAAVLANHGIAVTVRGGLIRVSPHAGTGTDSMVLLGDALAEFDQTRPAA